MTASPSMDQFEANLRANFEVGELTDIDLRRLYNYWLDFVSDGDRIAAQSPLFRMEHAVLVVGGMEWWEARQQGGAETVRPITMLDRANMLIATEDIDGARPAPRMHCPPSLVGRWRFQSWARGPNVEDVAEERVWVLTSDGRMETEGDPERHGWLWRVHLESFVNVWIGPSAYHVDEKWWIKGHDGDEIELAPPANGPVTSYRCHRAR